MKQEFKNGLTLFPTGPWNPGGPVFPGIPCGNENMR